MSVPKGAIYGLLGPSGCGKTSLLKLILGLIKPRAGKIRINGKRVGHPVNKIPGIGVGFMPQELALFQEITLNESLNYFSRLYGMSDELIHSRIRFLVDFFDLPNGDCLIGTMSCGQKRRVSLCLSLVHNPPFLILDEPTVGTDPLLKEKIWEHLVELSEMEGTTIIITTHYIEEARRAHIVALMRKGRLLVEHSPQFLLNYFCAQNLEEVFLRMCGNKVAEDMPENYYESRRMDFNGNVFFSNKVLMDDEIRDQKMISSVTSMDRKHYTSKESALKSVESDGIINRFESQINATDKDYDNSTIQFYGDFTDFIIMQTLMKTLREADLKFMKEIMDTYKPGQNTAMFDPIVKFMNPPVFGTLESNFRDFVAPGLIISLVYFMAVGLTALTLG
ncbi:unnamed protein product, partial [Oppiella nova]